VAQLLNALRQADAQEQVNVLATRAAACNKPDSVTEFPMVVQNAGVDGQAELPIDHGPDGEDWHQEQFWFGHEADGSPTKPWGWEDLS
jgi:hypothetical protein